MHKGFSIFLCILACHRITGEAASVTNFLARSYTDSQGVLPYRLFIPANYAPPSRYPLVLFLHGSGERGTNNLMQLTGQPGPLIFASETNQIKYPSFVIAPQCPLDGFWDDGIRDAQVMGLLDALQSEFSIDADRLYITGLSMGGFGTWDYIMQYPGVYAAAIPMSGGGSSDLAARITHMPIWNFHAANDNVVSVINSREIVSAVRKAGGSVIYTEYSNGGHGIWGQAYHTPILMDWIYSQRRGIRSAIAPILNIQMPVDQQTYASTGAPLSLGGTASDGAASVTLVTWTNYQGTQVGTRGTAAG